MKISRLYPAVGVFALMGCSDPVPAPAPERAPAVSTPPGTLSSVEAAATITPQDIYNRVAFLASDSLRGRDTPSPGLEAAAAYLIREYQRIGLEPGGDNATFYQRYPLRRFGLDTASVHFGTVLADGSGNEMLEYGSDFFAAPGGEIAGADMNHGRLIFVGRLGDAGLPTASYAGSIPIVTIVGGYSSAWRTEVARARRLAFEAGATAVIVVADSSFPEQTFRQLALSSRSSQTTSIDEEIAVIYLTSRAFARIASRAGASVRFARSGAAIPFEAVEAHFAAARRIIQDARPPNVVAILRGSDPTLREEYIVLSAHLDHVGVGPAVNGDSIYNGADDNGSGTSALVEVAEAMATLRTRPRRSVIFLHVSGEEKGLLGSEYFSDRPTVPLNRLVANINVDMIGRNGPDTAVVIGKNFSSLGATAERVAAAHPELGLFLSDDKWPEDRFFFRSDHYNFARKEIPAIFFFSGEHVDYHRPSDHVEKLDTDKAARIAKVIFYTTEVIANETARPRWDPRGLAEVRAMTR